MTIADNHTDRLFQFMPELSAFSLDTKMRRHAKSTVYIKLEKPFFSIPYTIYNHLHLKSCILLRKLFLFHHSFNLHFHDTKKPITQILINHFCKLFIFRPIINSLQSSILARIVRVQFIIFPETASTPEIRMQDFSYVLYYGKIFNNYRKGKLFV